MANLDGSRSHGGKWDILAGAMLRENSAQFTDIYRLMLRAARAEGIDRDRRPPLLETLLLPADAQYPRRKYLDWHREKIFVP
jgi:hypothetical protein